MVSKQPVATLVRVVVYVVIPLSVSSQFLKNSMNERHGTSLEAAIHSSNKTKPSTPTSGIDVVDQYNRSLAADEEGLDMRTYDVQITNMRI